MSSNATFSSSEVRATTLPPRNPPQSAVSPLVGAAGAGAGFATLVALAWSGLGLTWKLAATATVIAAVMVAGEILTGKGSKGSPAPGSKSRTDVSPDNRRFWETVALRALGLWSSVGLLGFLYWFFPLYAEPFYEPFFELAPYLAAIVLVGGPVYFCFAAKYASEDGSEDEYENMGRIVLMKLSRIDPASTKTHLLNLTIKGFFIPMMVSFAVPDIAAAHNLVRHWNEIGGIYFYKIFDFLYLNIFLMDALFFTVGYIFTFRALGTHIRIPETRLPGWIFCLICYPPFNSVTFGNYFLYSRPITWGPWLAQTPILREAWGICILFLAFIYFYSTVVFGLRNSNLTNRGIITAGPYRWSKHPAYISKNVLWWMTNIPFIADNMADVFRNMVLIFGVNFIYFMRAKCEERHLMADPAYVAYARWIDEHGWIARGMRAFRRVRLGGV